MLKIEGVRVPENLKEITTSKYKRFASFTGSDEETAYRMLQVFTDCENPLSLPVKTTAKLIDHLSKVLSTQPEFERRFEYEGKEYGFIPNLERMSMGEFMDIDRNLGDWKKIERVMSVLYRPIVKQGAGLYDIEPYTGTSDALKDLPIHYVIGAQVFFWTIASELVRFSLSSLESLTKPEEITRFEHSTGQSIAGLRQSILSLSTTLRSGKPSLINPQIYAS